MCWFLTIPIESRAFYCSLANGFIQSLICMHPKAIKQIQKLGQNILRFFIKFIYCQEKINCILDELYFSLQEKHNRRK